MKFSLFKNDKSTAKDEGILFAMILGFLLVGVVLFKTAPSFWIIDSHMTKAFGVIMVITAVMFVPSLIYRLRHNDRSGY